MSMSKILNSVEKKYAVYNNLFSFLKSKTPVENSWTLLEFGTGKYGFAKFYKEFFSEVIALDIEDYSEFQPGIDFLVYDGNSPIPMNDKSVDIVVSHSVLEHVSNLDFCLSEINRILRMNGTIYLTVDPLYYSGFGSHLYVDGERLNNWEHLVEGSEYFLIDYPNRELKKDGDFLNKLTSQKFLNAVSKQPWSIESYWLDFERKPINPDVDQNRFSKLELLTKGFRFVGKKVKEL